MAWSKSTRISVMLGIDIVFFLVELIVGLLVHSLALLADAFHMLNDIISLCVGLWAVAVARKATTDKYSYGWLRAEILGAFFNAVFLIALCVSILLEAVTRFFDPPDISNPVLMLIVGSVGLASNLIGFVVLGGHGHDHGHSHGDHSHGDAEHDHAHSHEHAAEEGRATVEDRTDALIGSVDGPATDLLPQVAVSRMTNAAEDSTPRRIRFEEDSSESPASRASPHANARGRERRRSQRHSRLTSIDDISIYPSSFRQEIIAASRSSLAQDTDGTTDDSEVDESPREDDDADEPEEDTPLLKSNGASSGAGANGSKKPLCKGSSPRSGRGRRDSIVHHEHNHNKPKQRKKKGGHSHGDMGLNGLIIHVIGDALGNLGVIITALIIWLTDWPGKMYADPAVSIFITLIILKSALPLTMATSKILLQATPDHIDLNEIREDIQALPGVISCHHVHIWQLSDTKIVASMHIQVSFPITAEGGEKYMELAKSARKCLHAYGIHSATIQPEFCLADDHSHDEDAAALRVDGAGAGGGSHGSGGTGTGAGSDAAGSVGSAVPVPADTCLLECVDNCVGMGCCSTGAEATAAASESSDKPPGSDSHSHSHSHSH